jgi:pyruvate formate lyase activating enzyme
MPSGLVLAVQRWSVHDGPGIRTTVFLQGCPLSCRWCHNPESQPAGPRVSVDPSRCVACEACLDACPEDLLAEPGLPPMPASRCRLCGRCADACPAEARRVLGRERSVAELMAELLRDRLGYDESGGGVTFSGGEPLAQPDFLAALLEACAGEELHTAVDTSGCAPLEDLLRVAPLTRLFLYDLKLVDDERHRAATGAGSTLPIANLRALAEVHRGIRLRIPVVPGWNDDEANVEASAELAAELPGLLGVDLLPYHTLGRDKFGRLGRRAPLEELVPPTPERLEQLAAPFRRRGLRVAPGGREAVSER